MTVDDKESSSPGYVRLEEKPFAGKATSWPKKLLYCLGILIFGILLPIPVSIVNAALQLLTFQPLQAVKSLIGGVVATVALVSVALVGIFPFILNRITSYAFCSADFEGLKQQNPNKEKILEIKGRGEIKRYFLPSSETVKSEANELCSIIFLGAAETYSHNLLSCSERHRYIFHYPGVDKSIKNNYRLESSVDAVNAGIAIVYDLIKEKNWTKNDIKKNLLLEGHSLGGGVAYQVALHFRKEHDIDIPVDGQNTFWSIRAVVAGSLKIFLNMPLWCGRLFSRFILAAGGGFELNTLEAALELNPECVGFNNVRYEKDSEWQERSVFQKIYNFEYQPLKAVYRFFWGSPHHDADYILTRRATLHEGMKESAKNVTETTTSYFQALGMTGADKKVARRRRHTWSVERKGYKSWDDVKNPSFRKKLVGFFINPFKKGMRNHQRFKRSDEVVQTNTKRF